MEKIHFKYIFSLSYRGNDSSYKSLVFLYGPVKKIQQGWKEAKLEVKLLALICRSRFSHWMKLFFQVGSCICFHLFHLFFFFSLPFVPWVIKTKWRLWVKLLGIFGKGIVIEAWLCKTEMIFCKKKHVSRCRNYCLPCTALS